MNRIVAAIFLVFLSGFARGATPNDYTFTLIPASPTAGEPFALRVDVAPGGCWPLHPLLPVSPQGSNVLRLEIVISDMCTPNLPAQERTYEIASLGAGAYTFRYAFCGPTMFGYTCTDVRDVPVTVVAEALSARPHTVPIWSRAGMVATVALFVLAALASFAGMSVKGR